MRGARLVVVMGFLGCATGGPPGGSAAPTAPAAAKAPAPAPQKNEVVVIGRGPQKVLPGEISIAPKDQGTDFVMHNRQLYRCTKLNPPPRDPENSQYCRAVHNGDSRNPDPGRQERSKTQSTWH
ncbi:MAG TPA: hypothetical protein VIG99_16585 [Myxococcaceae bacterium]